MRKIDERLVPAEVKQELQRQNSGKWLPTNDCTYFPEGGYYSNRSVPAVVYHQLENGFYAVKERYTT